MCYTHLLTDGIKMDFLFPLCYASLEIILYDTCMSNSVISSQTQSHCLFFFSVRELVRMNVLPQTPWRTNHIPPFYGA
jgi:hypothetical protein